MLKTKVFHRAKLTKERDKNIETAITDYIADRYPFLKYEGGRKSYAVRRFEFEITEADLVTPRTMKEMEWKLDIILDVEGCRVSAHGKHMIVHVPRNANERETLHFRDGLEEMMAAGKAPMRCYIGEYDNGEPVILDFTEVPHFLIGGTTGSGKSVCLHDIILSLMFSYTSREAQFFILDLKHEMGLYAGCPHVLATAFDERDFPNILVRIRETLKTRRALLKGEYIDDYNAKHRGNNKLPHIFIIFDETDIAIGRNSGSPVSDAARAVMQEVAAESRSCGIHLIMASQKPVKANVDSLIKSNLPGRLALSMTNNADSRAVIETRGADKLSGKGEGLLKLGGSVRTLQCAYISPEERQKAVEEIIKNQV